MALMPHGFMESETVSHARKIIHIDMDAFFASVEQRDHPEWKGLPVIVGGDPQSRGVVATCSYEARVFGIHSALSAAKAYRLCPQAIFVRPRMDTYRAASQEIMAVLGGFTDLVEPLSLDEAYLDVTDILGPQGLARDLALQIQQGILQKTGLTASAGVSYNKLLAKLASGWRKPHGLTVVPPGRGAEFLADLPIGKLHGIGPATARKMQELGIVQVQDLRKWTRNDLERHFGKAGSWYYLVCRGDDPRPVQPQRQRKSVGSERTFTEDIEDAAMLMENLDGLAERTWERLCGAEATGKTITVKNPQCEI